MSIVVLFYRQDEFPFDRDTHLQLLSLSASCFSLGHRFGGKGCRLVFYDIFGCILSIVNISIGGETGGHGNCGLIGLLRSLLGGYLSVISR